MAESPCLNWRKFAIPAGRIKSPLVARVWAMSVQFLLQGGGSITAMFLELAQGLSGIPPRGGPQGEPMASREEEYNSHYRIGAHNT